jgi:WD40-like Beta Propeller Repeat
MNLKPAISCMRIVAMAIAVGMIAIAAAAPQMPVATDAKVKVNSFANPQLVTINGYTGDAMEPFLSRDGALLFFNNSNDPSVDTNLYWAQRIDDLTFQFEGEIAGVNSTALDAVASMDQDNIFYFISTRSYPQTFSTIYSGGYAAGGVTGLGLVPGVSRDEPGWVNFDAEISADGNTLYFVDSYFGSTGSPQHAKIVIARRSGDTFVRVPESDKLLKNVNSKELNYAPCTSTSQLEIFFTRLDKTGPAIYTAHRTSTSKAFGTAQKIKAITGFAEAPTISPDSNSLYYHKNDDGAFHIYRVTR